MVEKSLWREFGTPSFPPGPMPQAVDVAIVGGGITGLTAALLLKQAGKRVAVLERDRIGSGETGRTSAHLTYVTDERLIDLIKTFGRDSARLVWEGGATAIDLIESNVAKLRIDCGFSRVPGFSCSPFLEDKDERDRLQADADVAIELGFAARFVELGPVTGKPAIAYADQAIFQPLQYIAALAQAVHGDGSFVIEQAEVGETVDDPLAVVVNGNGIACTDVVVATHVPLTGVAGTVSAMLFQSKIYAYSTYVMSGPTDDSLSPGLYSDTADPYYYLRVHEQDGARYAVFGGQDHKTGQAKSTEECFASLERAFRQLIPSVRIERRWSGQVLETPDGIPYIGMAAEHQYTGTGYAGNGLTFGTLAGIMLHDAVLGKKNPWQELFDPNRKATTPSAMATYVQEASDYPLYLLNDRLRPNRYDGPESVAPGEGRVVSIAGKRVACHRTAEGQLMKVSAVCTHLGCLVRWNDAEFTWDCPCHGSRFTPDGQVKAGPAESPLEPVEGD